MAERVTPVTDIARADWDRVIGVNLTAFFLGVQAVVPGMIERGKGSIILTASIAARRPRAGLAAYVAAKSGAVGLARQLALELAGDGDPRQRDQPRPGGDADARRVRLRRRPRRGGGVAVGGPPARPARSSPRTSRRLWPTSPPTTPARSRAWSSTSTRGATCEPRDAPRRRSRDARAVRRGPAATPADVDDAVARARRRARATARDWRTPARRAAALTALARLIEAERGRAGRARVPRHRQAARPGSCRRRRHRAATSTSTRAPPTSSTGARSRSGPTTSTTRSASRGACAARSSRGTTRCRSPRAARRPRWRPATPSSSSRPSWPPSLRCGSPVLAAEAGVPDGMLQVLCGAGDVGGALVAHPGVDHVTFVGSPRTGSIVAHACAERLAPVELELGGKSPNVVFADADLERVVPAVVRALVQNAGQSCSAGTRLLVERSRYDEVLEATAAALSALTIGPGLEDPDLGPLISGGQHAPRARDARARARRRRRASCRVGGGVPEAFADGWYVEPTLVADVAGGLGALQRGGLRARPRRRRRSTTRRRPSRWPTARRTGSSRACGPTTSRARTAWRARSGRARSS